MCVCLAELPLSTKAETIKQLSTAAAQLAAVVSTLALGKHVCCLTTSCSELEFSG